MKHIKKMLVRIEVHVVEDDGFEHDDAYYADVPGFADANRFSAISRADSTAAGLITEVIERYEGSGQ